MDSNYYTENDVDNTGMADFAAKPADSQVKKEISTDIGSPGKKKLSMDTVSSGKKRIFRDTGSPAKKQMSESMRIACILTLAGGFQDAYSYILRGRVYVNAQTGNIVMLAQSLSEGNFSKIPHYILPLFAFISGAYTAQRIEIHFKNNKNIHWRQIVLIIEIAFMIISGFLPHELDSPANMLLSFICAMQIVAFNKFRGNPFATTMCIGNLRTATTLLCKYHVAKNTNMLITSLHYFFIIFMFAVGAAFGAIISKRAGLYSIWTAAIFLIICLIMMFKEEAVQIKFLPLYKD